MKKLITGIASFRKKLTEEKRTLFAKLAVEQKPDALFIGCSDSRVVPNLFASTDPGDLFVIRNIGNLVPPSGSLNQNSCVAAALEFSIFSLNISEIIVCGHSSCGAMHSLAHGIDSNCCPSLKSWLKYGEASTKKEHSELIINPQISEEDQISQINVLQQLKHIKTYSFVRDRLEKNTLRLHGLWFDIAHADVYFYEPSLNRFVLIDEKEAKLILQRLG
jgi:carbonic anhydrase